MKLPRDKLAQLAEQLPFCTLEAQARCRSEAGKPTWLEVSITPFNSAFCVKACYLIVAREITERKRSESRLRELAYYDPLTGVPNRAYFPKKLEQVVADESGAGSALLLLLDLRTATGNGELHLVYQTQVSLRNGTIVGHESLARWHYPAFGALSPGARGCPDRAGDHPDEPQSEYQAGRGRHGEDRPGAYSARLALRRSARFYFGRPVPPEQLTETSRQIAATCKE